MKKRKNLYVDFINLENAYDRVSLNALLGILRLYRMHHREEGAIKVIYEGSKCCGKGWTESERV